MLTNSNEYVSINIVYKMYITVLVVIKIIGNAKKEHWFKAFRDIALEFDDRYFTLTLLLLNIQSNYWT